jgi:small ligand-binding sensory domain FIST
MMLHTTDRFISVSAAGTDWRDTARSVIEQLESARTENDGLNVGFIYISDVLSPHAEDILTLFKSVTKIDHWIGSVGVGICGVGEAYIGEPAISILVGRFGAEQFKILPTVDAATAHLSDALDPWLEDQEAMLTLVHVSGRSGFDVSTTLASMDNIIGGFMVGGMSSARKDFTNTQFADECIESGISGVVFSSDVETVTSLTQGCVPLGPVHKVTRCDGHSIIELDGQRAYDVFSADLQNFATSKADAVTDQMKDQTDLFKGEINVAFPVSGSDVRDYLVRPVLGVDADQGEVAIGSAVENGDHVMFVQRDGGTVCAELARTLIDLRARVQKNQGAFQPKGAIYISCIARAGGEQGNEAQQEMTLIQDVIGEVPLTGFYAYGEISNKRLYGYTGILILFL